jgi:hypothetical protein
MKKTQQKRSSDAIIVKGHLEVPILTITSGNGIINGAGIFQLSPNNLGGRPSVFSTLFSRYRFTSITIKYIPVVGTNTAGALAIGFEEDTGAATGDVLTDYFATVQLRKVMEMAVYMRTTLRWTPIDKEKWYYCQSDSGDSRFTVQSALVGNGTSIAISTTYGNLVISYCLEFEGALPSSTT